MLFSSEDLARSLPDIRPRLLTWACAKRPCTQEDAEDLVAETVRMALYILPEFDATTGEEGLVRWMTGILRCVILTDRQRAARRPKVAPIEAAKDIEAPPPAATSPFETALRRLPANQQDLVRGWLDGMTQVELHLKFRIHINTVANRLHLAFTTLRVLCPDSEALRYAMDEFAIGRRVTVYRKPKCPRPSWLRNHPPDFRFWVHGWEAEAGRSQSGSRAA